MPDVDQVTGPVAYHAEGPVWSPSWAGPHSSGLRWVDMLAGDVLSLRADGRVDRTHVGTVAAVVRPRTRGGAVIAVQRGFVFEDADGTRAARPEVWSDPAVRFNEGGCDPDGRLWCGSMAYDQSPGAGTVYRLEVDGTVAAVLTGRTVSNGLEWSPDGSLAYYNDTPTGRIAVFDYDRESGLGNERTLAEVVGGGLPDGLTVDAEGGVWTAVFNHGAVHRYSAAGSLEEVIDLPVKQVTACTFGGADLDQLFITSTAENLDRADDPQAGSLFVARPGVRGLPVRPYGG